MRINFAEMLQRGRNFCKEGVIGGGIAQLIDFGIDRRLIFRQINSQLGNLPGQNGADQKCDDQPCNDDGQDGRDTTQTAAPQQEAALSGARPAAPLRRTGRARTTGSPSLQW